MDTEDEEKGTEEDKDDPEPVEETDCEEASSVAAEAAAVVAAAGGKGSGKRWPLEVTSSLSTASEGIGAEWEMINLSLP